MTKTTTTTKQHATFSSTRRKRTANSSFGRGGAYDCRWCGRKTRETGTQSQGSGLCPQCYDLCGIDNELSDGHATVDDVRATAQLLLRELEAKGGNIARWSDLVAQLDAPAVDDEPVISHEEHEHQLQQEREHAQHPDLSEDYPGQRISGPEDAQRVEQLTSLLDDFATVQQQQEREHFYKAITVRYQGATNHRGARYSASDSDRNRCSVSIDHAYSDGGNARRAAQALCSKMGWPGQLAGGQQRPGVYVFVFVAGGAR